MCVIRFNLICLCKKGFSIHFVHVLLIASPPLEPPVLELRSNNGTVGEPVEVFVSARNISGSIAQLTISLSGFPMDTIFSKGTTQDDGSIALTESEFGKLGLTFSKAGIYNLVIIVTQDSGNGSIISRSINMTIIVDETDVSVDFHVCYSESRQSIEYSWSITVKDIVSNGETSFNQSYVNTIVKNVTLILPSWLCGLQSFTENCVYELNASMQQGQINVSRTLDISSESLNATITVILDEDLYEESMFNFQFLVDTSCDEG